MDQMQGVGKKKDAQDYKVIQMYDMSVWTPFCKDFRYIYNLHFLIILKLSSLKHY